MNRLDGKIALVTGGSQGIGLGAAQRLAEEGATVYLTGRTQETLDAAVAQVEGASAPGRAVGVVADVGSADDLDRLFGSIRDAHGHLDVVFANAGGGEFAALEDITPEHLDATFSRNVGGTVLTVQKALPLLREGASVILAGSTAASNGTPAFSVYAASKAAIRSFGRTWAAELAPRGIRVNTVAPGPVETPGLAGLAADEEQRQQMFAGMAASLPLGRLGQTSEIGAAVAFLASDDSSFMTGAELFVDGGAEQV